MRWLRRHFLARARKPDAGVITIRIPVETKLDGKAIYQSVQAQMLRDHRKDPPADGEAG